MKIDNCKNIKQMNAVLNEQNIHVNESRLAECHTITEMIKVCKMYGAK